MGICKGNYVSSGMLILLLGWVLAVLHHPVQAVLPLAIPSNGNRVRHSSSSSSPLTPSSSWQSSSLSNTPSLSMSPPPSTLGKGGLVSGSPSTRPSVACRPGTFSSYPYSARCVAAASSAREGSGILDGPSGAGSTERAVVTSPGLDNESASTSVYPSSGTDELDDVPATTDYTPYQRSGFIYKGALELEINDKCHNLLQQAKALLAPHYDPLPPTSQFDKRAFARLLYQHSLLMRDIFTAFPDFLDPKYARGPRSEMDRGGVDMLTNIPRTRRQSLRYLDAINALMYDGYALLERDEISRDA